jgi:endonuclease YncB( thermonuclease family)
MLLLALIAAPALCLATIHDGDTVRSCAGERIRIANIDAPELRGSPKCRRRQGHGWCDYAMAERSRNALAAFLASGRVTVHRIGTDRYGRTLATLAVNGRDAGAYLIQRNLARPWR